MGLIKSGSYPGRREELFISMATYRSTAVLSGRSIGRGVIDLSLPSSAQAKNERDGKIYSYACKWWTEKTFCTLLETALH
jgi:hypothetical protein